MNSLDFIANFQHIYPTNVIDMYQVWKVGHYWDKTLLELVPIF